MLKICQILNVGIAVATAAWVEVKGIHVTVQGGHDVEFCSGNITQACTCDGKHPFFASVANLKRAAT